MTTSKANRMRRGPLLRGVAYARYSTKYQHSIEDQFRACDEWAEKHGVEVVQRFEDRAARGKSSRRTGLSELRQKLEEGDVDVVIIFATNRLYRKMYKSLQFVEEEIVESGMRCVFVHSGIDTANQDRWRQRLQLYAMMDEFVVETASTHVHAALEGLLLQGRVFGTITFGYSGEIIPGPLSRHGRPPRRLVVDELASSWVRKIFHWFVVERMSLADIARRLIASQAPLPPKCGPRGWTRTAVRGILKNRRYLGEWSYGTMAGEWQGKKSYLKQVRRSEPIRTIQIPELRIIDDVLFARADERLTQLNLGAGRRIKSGGRGTRPKVLNGLLYCAEHQHQVLHVGGGHGQHMICPICKGSPNPYLYSMLPRRLTLKLVCERLAAMLVQDRSLIAAALEFAQKTIAVQGEADPTVLTELKQVLARVNRQIKFFMDNPGETDEDMAENGARLTELRRERATIQREVTEREQAARRTHLAPNEESLRKELERLGAILTTAAMSEDPIDAAAAHRLIRALTGGRILVSQAGERLRKKGYVRLSFSIDRFAGLSEIIGPAEPEAVAVEIDVQPEDSMSRDLERVQPLFEHGMLICDIAKQTGLSRGYVSKLWQLHAEANQIETDGRKRRAQLSRKQSGPTMYDSIAEKATDMAERGASVLAIANACNVGWPTANRALREHRAAHDSYRDAKLKQRQAIRDRIVKLFVQGMLLNEIAAEMDLAPVTVRNALRTWFESQGKTMPDLRGRRHSIAAGRKPGAGTMPNPTAPEG